MKPANMLVDSRPGQPDHLCLSDFGLSKGTLSAASLSLTGSAEVFGTPDYLAPEQASGAAVDSRSDQYALACAAFVLLAGVPVFVRDHPMAVLLAHMSAPPPSLTALRPDLPPAAGQVLARALSKAPGDRFASCGHFAAALTGALAMPSPAASAAVPAGGIVSTVADLATWVTWLGAAFHEPAGPEVLSRASRREMQRLETIMPPLVARRGDGGWQATVAGYGLGLVIDHDLHRGISVSHSGGLPGYLLHMRWHPASGDGIICLTNSHRGNPSALARDAHHQLMTARKTPSATITLWPETVQARLDAETLIRDWTAQRADALFAENIEFDRPVADRRGEVEALIEQIGPLRPALPVTRVVAAATPADVTWSIPGERGEILAYIHLTPLDPPKVQEFTVVAVPAGTPRSAAPRDISPRRTGLGEASLSEAPNVRVIVPEVSG